VRRGTVGRLREGEVGLGHGGQGVERVGGGGQRKGGAEIHMCFTCETHVNGYETDVFHI